MTSDPGPMPDPKADEPEPRPGGPDAADDPEHGETPGEPTVPDLDPDANPAVDEAAPDEVKEGDDKAQEPEGGTSGEDDLPDEPSA